MDKELKLIEGCLAGKRKAQNELYSRFAPALFGICLRYASNKFEAQDMLQEGFIKVFSSLATFENKGSIEGWIKRVVVNNALNYLRAKARLQFTSDLSEIENLADNIPEIDETAPPPNSNTMLGLIQQLPEGYRMVFNLYVMEDYSHKEIAEIAGISENTSKTQLMRARNLLQKKISELPR